MDGTGMEYMPSTYLILWINRCGTNSCQMDSNFPPNKLYNARANGSDRGEDKGQEMARVCSIHMHTQLSKYFDNDMSQ